MEEDEVVMEGEPVEKAPGELLVLLMTDVARFIADALELRPGRSLSGLGGITGRSVTERLKEALRIAESISSAPPGDALGLNTPAKAS